MNAVSKNRRGFIQKWGGDLPLCGWVVIHPLPCDEESNSADSRFNAENLPPELQRLLTPECWAALEPVAEAFIPT